MSTPGDRPPLLNQSALHELEEELDDPGRAHAFAEDYAAIWDERYLRLVDAVQHGDTSASLDALLSVRTASTLIGAARLANLAADLEYCVKCGNLKAVAEALPAVRSCGAATVSELITKYINTDW